jgi:hypothetical protein
MYYYQDQLVQYIFAKISNNFIWNWNDSQIMCVPMTMVLG